MARTTNLELSAVDRRILRALQEDGRMTVQAIAEKVGLSASPCLRRIRQLLESYPGSATVAEIDEVIVTGSRIRRDPTNSPTPLIQITGEQLTATGQARFIAPTD